jgi:hypothetical protein
VRRAALLGALALAWAAPAAAQHDDEIRRILVEDSLARFNGYCPCPYSYDRGQQCAEKSAYSQRAAHPRDLYCYPQDVPLWEVEAYRRRMGIRR